MFNPRPRQAEVLKYRSGKMGISAVPGSGKTHTLSALAATLIKENCIHDDQEILIVTLVNSAVDNFSSRIASFVSEAGLLKNMGYRVRTLHGLSHDIVRERPEKAGVSESFSIVDEGESSRMIDGICSAYMHEHPTLWQAYVSPEIDFQGNSYYHSQWNNLVLKINANFITQAKDLQQEPAQIRELLEKNNFHEPLMDMAVEVYTQYQRGLRFRSAVDFSDLIRLAYRVLRTDNEYLERLRYRWPYILEDEAQDSSELQEKILSLLTGESGNWVRVGDPNQAIYETFTTASPRFLKEFLRAPGVDPRSLPNSGRSNLSIIELANNLIRWSNQSAPNESLRESLSTPLIEPAPPGDPQPNPPDEPHAIYIGKSKYKSDQEVAQVVKSIQTWLPSHPDKSIAVLCPIGDHGEKVVAALQAAGIKVVELLKSSQSTRRTARILEKILLSIDDPSASKKCAAVFHEIYDVETLQPEEKSTLELLTSKLLRLNCLEDFLYPLDPGRAQVLLNDSDLSPSARSLLEDFRFRMIHWHAASVLPVDQLILTLAQDLFDQPADLAICHKFALLLEFAAANHPEYDLSNFANELKEIASNERKFLGFSEEDSGFDPDHHKGEVFVSTFHKAKGLEWDRVYLLSVNNYDFPSAEMDDEFLGEKWFIRGRINLEAETLSKLKALVNHDPALLYREPGEATREARYEYAAERYRLLFVGITRARENLIITWNTGKFNKCRMALPLVALHALREEKNAAQ